MKKPRSIRKERLTGKSFVLNAVYLSLLGNMELENMQPVSTNAFLGGAVIAKG